MIKSILFVGVTIGAFLLGGLFGKPAVCGAACDKKIVSVTASDFRSFVSQKGKTIIDVRTPEEFAGGHIDGAINVDFNNPKEFENFLSSRDKQGDYLVYCRSGNRSSKAIKKMEEKGFIKLTDLSGGIQAWQGADYPVTLK